MRVAIAPPDLALPEFRCFVGVFMLNDRVAVLLQFADFTWRGVRSDGVSRIGSKANSVIENLDAVLADQIDHGGSIRSANRDPISWHRKSPRSRSRHHGRLHHEISGPGKDSLILTKTKASR